MRVLLLDIETAPNVAFIWKLYDDYVSPDMLVKHSYVLCVSAKWLDEKGMQFLSVWKDGEEKMLKGIHDLMDEADLIIHYNGKKFDIPTLNREFITHKMSPPSPYKQLDLLSVARSQFKFTSNKLDFVCQHLGLGTKVKHKGIALWQGCMNDNRRDQKMMENYNKRDVILLERLYKKLLPWIPKHPSVLGGVCTRTIAATRPGKCPHCGSKKYHSKGFFVGAKDERRYQCMDCTRYFRGDVDGKTTFTPTTRERVPKDRPPACPRCGHWKFESRGYYESGAARYHRYRCCMCKGFFHGERDSATKTVNKAI